MKLVYLCEDSPTDIFSAVHPAWRQHLQGVQTDIALAAQYETEFFCEYLPVEPSAANAAAVTRMIRRHLGSEAEYCLYTACLAADPQKASAVLQTLFASRTLSDSRRIMDHLSHPSVQKVAKLSRFVGNEAHFFMGFVRFQELRSQVLFSEITPKSFVLPVIAEHFSNRLPLENWVIYDKTHHVSLVHQKQQPWFLLSGSTLNELAISELSDTEKSIEELWIRFFHTIAIKERTNLKLQTQNLRKRFQRDMVEFQ
ncbi:MAG: TIGR03915 family putative DNA repair protein [Lachnospiraceae bacterium]